MLNPQGLTTTTKRDGNAERTVDKSRFTGKTEAVHGDGVGKTNSMSLETMNEKNNARFHEEGCPK